jgi:hypothetical protein
MIGLSEGFESGELSNWEQVPQEPPHDRHIWVKVDAHILDKESGEIRIYHDESIWDEDAEAPATFIWSDGNYACDCNRASFFEQAGGENSDHDHECGDSRYLVKLVNPKTGKTFYNEFLD